MKKLTAFLVVALCFALLAIPARAQTMEECFMWMASTQNPPQGPCEDPGFIMAPNGVCMPPEQLAQWANGITAYCNSMEPFYFAYFAYEMCMADPAYCYLVPAETWLLYFLSNWPW